MVQEPNSQVVLGLYIKAGQSVVHNDNLCYRHRFKPSFAHDAEVLTQPVLQNTSYYYYYFYYHKYTTYQY